MIFLLLELHLAAQKSPIKKIDKIRVYKNKNDIILIFESKSFLQNQVRSMVGSLKFLGEGK